MNYSMTTPSAHLVRATRKDFFKSPVGKVTLFVTTACPALRPHKGVISQYLRKLDNQISSEGKQAVDRFKAYKKVFLDVVNSNELPRKGHKHIMPLLKLVCMFREEPKVLLALHTVLRSYDLYHATEKQQEADYLKFVEQFITADESEIRKDCVFSTEEGKINFTLLLDELLSRPKTKLAMSRFRFPSVYQPKEEAILLTRRGTAASRPGQRLKKGLSQFAPSIIGAPAELKALPSVKIKLGDITNFGELLHQFQNLIGAHSFPSMIGKKVAPPTFSRGQLKASLRRHVRFGNPGFKTRIIAVADYWTQYTLSPIHDWAFKCLRGIPADYTFSHEKGFRRLSLFTKDRPFVACYDLSAATDAFPATFSRDLLAKITPGGGNIATLWWLSMTYIPFQKGWYKVGQPMGLLSSWAVFSLSHHFMVWIAAMLSGILDDVLDSPQDYYGIVGDDIFICHPALAHHYQLLMNAIGVKINLTKSLVVHGSTTRISEFVKRNSYKGNEISAISPNLIVKSFHDYACLRELVLKLKEGLVYTNLADEAHQFDVDKLYSMYGLFGSDFIRAAIDTMCTVPTKYAGLHSDECMTQWSPLTRINFLARTILNSIEYETRSLFIGSDGYDHFNDLTKWLLEDIVPDNYFPVTPLNGYLRKQSEHIGLESLKSKILASKLVNSLEELTDRVSSSLVTFTELKSFEDSVLADHLRSDRPFSFSSKAVDRAETRSLAYAIFKIAKRQSDSKNHDYDKIISDYLMKVHSKYTLSLPQISSEEDFYSQLFSKSADQESGDLSPEDLRDDTKCHQSAPPILDRSEPLSRIDFLIDTDPRASS